MQPSIHTGFKKTVLVLSVTMLSIASFAIVLLDSRGNWPSSWPKELEAYRTGARTITVANGLQETQYEIPILSRQEFQKMWPHILSLKSKGAPIILKSSPPARLGALMSGIRVLCPSGGETSFANGTRLKAAAPWPDSAKLPSGELAEYVVEKNGTWVPCAGPDGWRARVDIEVVLDGSVLSRSDIVVPEGTRVVDKR